MRSQIEVIKLLTHTDTKLDNTPTDEEKAKLYYLYCYLMKPIEDKFGEVSYNSGYRSEAVNKAVGGAKGSQHRLAEACDFTPQSASIEEVFKWCRENLLFGQLIDEEMVGRKWIHISMVRLGGMNLQCMKYRKGAYLNV